VPVSRRIRFLVEWNITPGRFDDFEQVARAMTLGTQPEPGSTVYDWYLSRDRLEARLYEEYVDAAAVVAHMEGHVVVDLVPRLASSSTLARFEVYGDPGRHGADLLTRAGARIFADWHAIDR
jgi:quinol monooxygenase YgiN